MDYQPPAEQAAPPWRVFDMTPTLVLGIGNILLKDEGVGVHVVQALHNAETPPGVELYDGGTFGIDLIDTIAGRKRVIVVDAVQADKPPATVLRFTDKELRIADCGLRIETEAPGRAGGFYPHACVGLDPQFAIRNSQSLSLHQVGLLETLLMARQLGCAPEEVVIFGIVPKDMSPGLELSEEVAAVVPKVVELVLAELRR